MATSAGSLGGETVEGNEVAGDVCALAKGLRPVAPLMKGLLTLVPSTPRSASHLSSTSRLKTQGRASANTVTADCGQSSKPVSCAVASLA